MPCIANTGIQFYRAKCYIDKIKLRSKKFVYFEDVELNRRRFWLEELIAVPEADCYARKSELRELAAVDSLGLVKKDFDPRLLKRKFIEDQPHVFEIGNVDQVLKAFENKWIPLPYFKYNSINQDVFGPTDWVRIMCRRSGSEDLEFVLAVDTTISDESSSIQSPYLDENPQENKFRLCSNEDLILGYFDSLTDCKWVDDYVSSFFKFEDGESQTKHIASFIFFLRILISSEKLPNIQMLSDKSGVIDVDLVVDIGNSRTCALLFENPNDLKFNLNKVKQLRLTDLSNPFNVYNESFSTRVVFREALFYNKTTEINQYKKFQWPSLVRLGTEGEDLLNKSIISSSSRIESKSFNSSPKRYLWDQDLSEVEWCFFDVNSEIPKKVFKTGISEQLKSDGSISYDGIFGTNARFSRKSLMTFAFLEILAQSFCQINSFEFRMAHGEANYRRRLKRILISCPTAMIKEEQVALRECAKDAVKIFLNYSRLIKGRDIDYEGMENEIEIIPDPTDLKKDLQNLEKRKDWIYDEATASQILYIYSSIQHKFNGNPKLFFDLYGKPNTSNNSKNKELVIGSLDVGAGTTDLLICKYSYNYAEATEIIPTPIYWESFSFAGDNLIKNIIQEIILEGEITSPEDQGCSGVILNTARDLGIDHPTLKLNGFFGKDHANMSQKARTMRISFLNQIGLPIALKYLEIASKETMVEDELTFDQIFNGSKPDPFLLDYFQRHFGFRFEDLTWKISRRKIDKIITETFSKLLSQVSKIMHLHGCDLIILSGRPCSFKALENTLLKYLPVAPNRLVNLNHYWIGKWYPFADDNGYIKDPKTVISVGTLLGMMGGKLFKLDKFRIDITNLKNNLVSTADYLGAIDDYTIHHVFMNPNQEESSFMIYDLPHYIGFQHVKSPNYPSRYLYSFQFNNKNIREQLGVSLHNESTSITDELENRKTRLRSRLPFKVTITRDFDSDKEKIKIDHILDANNEDISKLNFELKLLTLDQSEDFWLDTGEFTLTIGKNETF